MRALANEAARSLRAHATDDRRADRRAVRERLARGRERSRDGDPRDHAGPDTAQGPRTQITDRPVTIVTRSLISQPQRASSPRLQEQLSASTNGATGKIVIPEPEAAIATAIRADGTPAPELQRLSAGLLPGVELASVHGGATFTNSGQVALPASNKWTFGVLGLAALLGVTAAIVIQLAPDKEPIAPIATSPQPSVFDPPIADGRSVLIPVRPTVAVESPPVTPPTAAPAPAPAPPTPIAAPVDHAPALGRTRRRAKRESRR